MSTKQVSNAADAIQKLTEAAKAHGPAIDAAFAERQKALNLSAFSFSPSQVIVALAAYAISAAEDASKKDQSHGVDKGGEKDPQITRDEAKAELLATLREIRRQLSAQFDSADVATVFAKWPLPETAAELAAEAEQVASALPQRAPKWTARHAVIAAVDPVLAASTVSNEVAILKAAIKAAATSHGTSHASLAERNAATARMNDARKGFLHLAEGILEMAGLGVQADGLVTHHHIGRPHKAAPSDESKEPKSKPQG